MRPEEFLTIVGGMQRNPANVRVVYGRIPAVYTSGRPTVQFDGEDEPGLRQYPYLSSYSPKPDDRVAVLLVNNGGFILGNIV